MTALPLNYACTDIQTDRRRKAIRLLTLFPALHLVITLSCICLLGGINVYAADMHKQPQKAIADFLTNHQPLIARLALLCVPLAIAAATLHFSRNPMTRRTDKLTAWLVVLAGAAALQPLLFHWQIWVRLSCVF